MTNHPVLLSPSHPNHKQLHHVNHHHYNQQSSSGSQQLLHSHSSGSSSTHPNHHISSFPSSSSNRPVPTPNKSKKSTEHSSHNVQHISSIAGLWMLVDGIGLAIITAATILEGIELWKGVFKANWSDNSGSLLFWLCGRTSQIIGLFFLIGHASSFQIFPEIEQFGMLMLTVGPILNLSSCLSFHIPTDTNYLYNRQWFCSESLELIGILVLDISMIHMEEIYVLTAEITGFILLCCAAGLHFEYHADRALDAITASLSSSNVVVQALQQFPQVTLRLDMVHGSECLGLIMLMVVAYGQFRLKIAKHESETLPTHHAHSPSTTLPQRKILQI
eukprot:gene16053-18121_t